MYNACIFVEYLVSLIFIPGSSNNICIRIVNTEARAGAYIVVYFSPEINVQLTHPGVVCVALPIILFV